MAAQSVELFSSKIAYEAPDEEFVLQTPDLLEKGPGVGFTFDQIEIKGTNFLPVINLPEDKRMFAEAAAFLRNCPLSHALTYEPAAHAEDIMSYWYTARAGTFTNSKNQVVNTIEFNTRWGFCAFNTGLLRAILRLPERGTGWDASPTDEQLVVFLDAIKYKWPRTTAPWWASSSATLGIEDPTSPRFIHLSIHEPAQED